VVLLALAMLGGLGFSWYVGGVLIAPANHPVDPPPAALGASAVTFASESGSVTAHVDLHEFVAAEYERRVDAFFEEALNRRAAESAQSRRGSNPEPASKPPGD
jgi:hypothetical protein